MHLECYWFRFTHEKKGGGNKSEREKAKTEREMAVMFSTI